MNYHPKHTSNSRTPVWIGAGVLAAVAIGAIKAIREAGYSIPEDISIVGFDDIPSAR